MDKFNELAKTFKQRTTLHVYANIDGIEVAYQTGKEFVKYLKSEWTEDFVNSLFDTEFEDISAHFGNAVYKSSFSVITRWSKANYQVTIYIERD